MKCVLPYPIQFWQNITGWVLWQFEKRCQVAPLAEKIGDLELFKVLKQPAEKIGFTIALYRNTKTKAVVLVKSVPFHVHHLLYILLRHEAYMGAMIAPLLNATKSIVASNLIEVFTHGQRLYVVREYVAPAAKAMTGKDFLKHFDEVQSHLRAVPIQGLAHISRRSVWHTVFFMTSYMLLALRKSPRDWKLYVSLWRAFFGALHLQDLHHWKPTLIHRDLTPENLLIDEGKPVLLDLETMAIGEENTDVALLLRFGYRSIPKQTLLHFVEERVITSEARRSVVRLAIFYAFQFLAHEEKQSEFYDEATQFLPWLKEEIIPTFQAPSRSWYEKISQRIFALLAHFPNNTYPSTILCYHSVGSDNWRFSTEPTQLRAHLSFLQQHYRFVSLSEMLTQPEKNGQVAITFDDGYANLLSEAAPLMREFKVKPTVFALATPKHARRDELANELPLLSDAQLVDLAKQGWEIGSHTLTHADLLAVSEEELQREVAESKTRLEKKVSRPVRYLAYPRGGHSEVIQQAVAKAGYDAAFTVERGSLVGAQPWAVPRLPLEGDTPVSVLAAQLSPLGSRVHAILLQLLVLKAQLGRKAG